MTKLEADYAKLLEERRIAGVILRWDYEPEHLRLADRTYYVPDFRVLMADGTVEFHEVKGLWLANARTKIKVAAELHPYRFLAVMRRAKKDGGGWVVEDFGDGGGDE